MGHLFSDIKQLKIIDKVRKHINHDGGTRYFRYYKNLELKISRNKVTFDRVAYFGLLETEQIISAPRHAPVATLGAFSPHPPSTAIAFLHQLAYNIEVTQGVPRLRLRWGIASDPHNLMKLILT